jgi:hypothetical protein
MASQLEILFLLKLFYKICIAKTVVIATVVTLALDSSIETIPQAQGEKALENVKTSRLNFQEM